MHVASGMIDADASTDMLVLEALLTECVQQSASRVADEVVH